MMGATLPFAAHCAKGHDRIDFTDRDLFTRHMKGEHKATSPTLRAVKAAPWKAPKAPTDNAKLAAVLVAAGDVVTDVSGVDGFVGPGSYRWDDETPTPPLEVLPSNVRPILAGAVARGERWGVNVAGHGVVHLSVGRTRTEQAQLTIRDGKVQATETRLAAGTEHTTQATLAEVKREFPAA